MSLGTTQISDISPLIHYAAGTVHGDKSEIVEIVQKELIQTVSPESNTSNHIAAAVGGLQ